MHKAISKTSIQFSLLCHIKKITKVTRETQYMMEEEVGTGKKETHYRMEEVGGGKSDKCTLDLLKRLSSLLAKFLLLVPYKINLIL